MQRATFRHTRWHMAVLAAASALLLFCLRDLVWQAVRQLFLGALVAWAALPGAKWLEKRLSANLSAALALGMLGAAAIGTLLVVVPSLAAQGKQLVSLFPSLWKAAAEGLGRAQARLGQMGITVDAGVQKALFARGQEALAEAAPAVINWMSGMAGGVGQWLLAPVFGFYFLKDRKNIAQRLLWLLPEKSRGLAVRIAREMRRETAGYLRGQMMISAIVGALTAAGLFFCGVPSWLVLGVLMGVLELIPYAGPFIGGLLAALCALPGGWTRVLWALGVVVAVQQLDGSWLSPKLISQTTRLHPAVVILCVVLGGAAAGMAGILFSIPLVLCVRAALRVIAQHGVKPRG